ncbi:hypothetical protein [Amycolatopsis balhimycina]|uniref:hypothetical protein n=1 Tax=Amycolatopsis balhimycina TaxID=208443 RepID=UPI00163C087C|nr:hypothetical protein [Amycolatopsis balhimycina]
MFVVAGGDVAGAFVGDAPDLVHGLVGGGVAGAQPCSGDDGPDAEGDDRQDRGFGEPDDHDGQEAEQCG